MASWIAELNSIPELIVSSDSQRTRDTATFLLNEFRNTSIDFTNELYHASPHQILNVIHQVPNNVETVMVLAHNPGITYAFDSLASVNIDNVPTSGVGAIRFDVNSFHEIQPNSGKLEFFIYPKKPRN
jgi:phosphohistidine phosphatase